MIYIAQPEPGGPVKIGYTSVNRPSEAMRRIKALEPGCPWPLRLVCTVNGTRNDEANLHARFARFRTHREWFRPEGELALWIRGLGGDLGPAHPLPTNVVPFRPPVPA